MKIQEPFAMCTDEYGSLSLLVSKLKYVLSRGIRHFLYIHPIRMTIWFIAFNRSLCNSRQTSITSKTSKQSTNIKRKNADASSRDKNCTASTWNGSIFRGVHSILVIRTFSTYLHNKPYHDAQAWARAQIPIILFILKWLIFNANSKGLETNKHLCLGMLA